MITMRNAVFSWGTEHRSLVTFMSAVSLSRIATTIVYGVLPILVATSYGDWQSGLFFGVMNFLQAFIGDPLAGILADRWGSKPIVIAGYGFVAAAAVLWFFIPLDTFIALTVFSLLIFASFSFRDESDAYLLRMSRRNEGGFIFGIAENLYAFANFIAALAIPFFIVTSMHRSAALVMLVTSFFSCLVTLKLPNDKKRSFNFLKKRRTPRGIAEAMRAGWHFVRKNKFYPLLTLGGATFEGIFYGTIWFVIPLQIASRTPSLIGGLELGIYEIMTVALAGYSGYLADRYDWRTIHTVGWVMAMVGTFALIFSPAVWWLVMIGGIIAIGNNFFAFAASHALEAHDIDHREDGSFIGIRNFATDIGYAIGPVIAGLLYAFYGFAASLSFAVIATSILGCAMIWFGLQKKR